VTRKTEVSFIVYEEPTKETSTLVLFVRCTRLYRWTIWLTVFPLFCNLQNALFRFVCLFWYVRCISKLRMWMLVKRVHSVLLHRRIYQLLSSGWFDELNSVFFHFDLSQERS